MVENLFNNIGCEEGIIATARRFRGTDPTKIPPIFVKLKPGVDRFKVVSAARNLRDKSSYQGVYGILDRTEAEREFDKGLREIFKNC